MKPLLLLIQIKQTLNKRRFLLRSRHFLRTLIRAKQIKRLHATSWYSYVNFFSLHLKRWNHSRLINSVRVIRIWNLLFLFETTCNTNVYLKVGLKVTRFGLKCPRRSKLVWKQFKAQMHFTAQTSIWHITGRTRATRNETRILVVKF